MFPFFLLWLFSYGLCTNAHRFSKLEKPCTSTHMVFKLSSPLDFQASKTMCVGTYGFQAFFFRFSSLKTHVHRHIWFSRSLQLWISELENPCVSMHMVFKLFSTLDFWAWKPMCISTYSFQTQLNFRFFCLKTHVC